MKKILILLSIYATVGQIYAQSCQDAGLGTNTPGSKLEIRGCTNLSNASALNVTDSNTASIFYIRNDHKIGINTTSPASLFSIGSSNQFQVNTTGNLIKLNNVTYSWPSSQGGANTVLSNDGSGNLSWSNGNSTNWTLTGNSGTNPSTNYIGTSDAQDLVIKTSASERMRIFSGGKININGSGSTFSAGSSILNVGGAGASTDIIYSNQSSTTDGSTAIYGTSATPSGGHNYAVIGLLTSGGSGYAFGTYGKADGGNSTGRGYGIYGVAGNATAGYNYGVYGTFTGSNNAAAIFGTESLGDVNVSGKWAGYYHGRLYADTITVSATTEPVKYPLYVNGIIYCNSSTAYKLTNNTWTVPSDKRLKTVMGNFSDGLNVIRQINPIKYKYNGIGGLPSDSVHIGILAQDVQAVAPYCISSVDMVLNESDAKKFKGSTIPAQDEIIYTPDSVNHTVNKIVNHRYKANVLTYNYDGLVYAMINSIKELAGKNDAMESEIADLKAQIAALKNK